jgi:hypothetical protein
MAGGSTALRSTRDLSCVSSRSNEVRDPLKDYLFGR